MRQARGKELKRVIEAIDNALKAGKIDKRIRDEAVQFEWCTSVPEKHLSGKVTYFYKDIYGISVFYSDGV